MSVRIALDSEVFEHSEKFLRVLDRTENLQGRRKVNNSTGEEQDCAYLGFVTDTKDTEISVEEVE